MAETTRVEIAKMKVQIKHLNKDMGQVDKKVTDIKKFLFSENGKDGLTEKLNECFATKDELRIVEGRLKFVYKILFVFFGAGGSWVLTFALRKIFGGV